MRRVALVAFLVAAIAAPAHAATTTVAVKNFSFSPQTVGDAAGASVRWENNTGTFHNVASAQSMFTSGAPQPVFTFTRTFSAGTYPYMCEVHPTMQGRIRIRPRLRAAPTGLPFTVRWATASTNTGSSFRVQYRIGSGNWKVWRSATTTDAGVFGRNRAPVAVRSGKLYGFRVRSAKGTNRSNYSPVVTFRP